MVYYTYEEFDKDIRDLAKKDQNLAVLLTSKINALLPIYEKILKILTNNN